jgi:RNA polymerase sigma-70 factor (ECF subfamily)
LQKCGWRRMDEPGTKVTELVARTRAGDEEAARELVAVLTPLVGRIVRAHLPRRTSEEDLVQMVLTKVFTRLDQFRGVVPLEHWVARISVNTCRNELARESHRPEIRHADLSEEQEAVLQNLAGTEVDLPGEQDVASRELVAKMLAALSPDDRLVITLLHLEGRTVDEIKALTGWSAPLVKVRAFRARRKMKQHLARLLKEHQP